MHLQIGNKDLVLTGLSNQSSDELASKFCKKHRLGAKTKAQIIPLVDKKLEQHNSYTGVTYKKVVAKSPVKKAYSRYKK